MHLYRVDVEAVGSVHCADGYDHTKIAEMFDGGKADSKNILKVDEDKGKVVEKKIHELLEDLAHIAET